jgi:hypothetical protein
LKAPHTVVALHGIRITSPAGSGKILLKVHVNASRGKFRLKATKGIGATHTASSVTLTGTTVAMNRALNNLVLIFGSQKSGGRVTISASAGNLSGQATIKIIA